MTQIEQANRQHAPAWVIVIVLLYGLSLLLVNLGRQRVLTKHEVWAAQPAREMLHGGQWVLPRIGGVIRTNKPPTMSWLIAASMKLTASQNELAARLPAALSGVATALIVVWLAGKFYDALIALVAGLMQLTCFYVLMQSGLAEADMPLCLAVTAALAALAAATLDDRPRRGPWLTWAFYLFTGISFMLKGLAGPMFILTATAAFLLLRRRKSDLLFLASPKGIVLLIVLVSTWPLAAYCSHPQIISDWKREQVGRFFGELGGSEPVYFYLYIVPLLLLPWVFMLLPGLSWLAQKGEYRREVWRFFLCWFMPGFVVLSACAFRHKHYAIPLLPPFSILMAGGLLHWIRRQHAAPRWHFVAGATAWIVLCAVGAAIVWWLIDEAPLVICALIGVMCLGGLLVLYLEHCRRPTGQLAAIFATAWVVAFGVQRWVMPAFDTGRPIADLARRAAAVLPSGHNIRLLGLGEHQITYYLPLPIERIDLPEQYTAELSSREVPVYAIADDSAVEALRGAGAVQVLDQTVPPTTGRHKNWRPVYFIRFTAPRASTQP